MVTRAGLLRASPRELARVMAAGHPIDADALGGWVYRGTSLGLPAWLERLTWKKFAKVFARDAATGAVHGWNVRVVQDGLDRPWTLRRGAAFGAFAVTRDADGGVVLDYGAGGGLLRALRDPLVALAAGSTEVLLGRSLVAVGGAALGTPSYFLLERGERVDAAVPAPRRTAITGSG